MKYVKKCRNGPISVLCIKYHEQFQEADPGSGINPTETNVGLKYEKEKMIKQLFKLA